MNVNILTDVQIMRCGKPHPDDFTHTISCMFEIFKNKMWVFTCISSEVELYSAQICTSGRRMPYERKQDELITQKKNHESAQPQETRNDAPEMRTLGDEDVENDWSARGLCIFRNP